MSFVVAVKDIHCPNCHFKGKAKLKSTAGLGWILFLILFIVSFFFWPLFFVTAILFFALLFKPALQICPKCNWANPIPLEQWQTTQKTPQ